ncbi:MAG: HAMP domain-containing histidine kinase, partial [Alphaproteobacteria bacterium]|nr:HAMP domain-containing histidine kinase [Alphaproteobacteria bacterium]
EPLRRSIAPDDVAAKRSLELIERSVARLDTLVSDARDLEEAVAEVLYPEARPLDLSEFVTNLAQSYAEALALQKKRLTLAITPGITAYGNEDLLEPVLENLLENAASFTREGGAIELSLSRANGLARLVVADRGPGADPQHLPHLFDRHASFRTGQSNTMHHQGLGLWIVKRNVEGLGGTVAAHNREGGGFEVAICLKLKP